MGFLDRVIKDGISKGLGNAIGKAVQNVVEPRATDFANKTAEQFDQATKSNAEQAKKTSNELDGAFATLQRSMENYATEMSKNVKVCPKCENATTADKTFCPNCGTKLPESTLADGAVCADCGFQNSIGTAFCQNCGKKLPAAVAKEEAVISSDSGVMSQWKSMLPQYPVWCFGGDNYELTDEDGYFMFTACFSNEFSAKAAVEKYAQLLMQNGFRPASETPTKDNLYKMINGVCYHVDLEHCFDSDSCAPSVCFAVGEPSGGFYY